MRRTTSFPIVFSVMVSMLVMLLFCKILSHIYFLTHTGNFPCVNCIGRFYFGGANDTRTLAQVCCWG